MSQAENRNTTTTIRRALLAGAPAVAVAALAGGTVANGVTIGMAKAGEVDPVLAVIDRHRSALEQYDATHAILGNGCAVSARRRTGRVDRLVARERLTWRRAEMERAKRTPRNTAYELWNDQTAEVSESTEALVATIPTTIAGVVIALEHWAKFSARIGDDSQFDFLEQDCGSRLLTSLAAALRSVIERT